MRLPHRSNRMVGALVALAAFFGSMSIANADGPVDQQKAKVDQIADELDSIGNRLDQLDEDYNGALDRQAALDADIADRQTKVSAQEAELATLEQQLSKLAVDRFVSGGSNELSPLFADSASYADAQQRDQLSNVAIDNGNGDADKMQSLVDDLNQERKELESKQKEQADLIASLADKRAEADQLQTQYQDKLTSAKAELGDLVQQEQERRAAEAVAAAKAQMAAAMQKAAADQQTKSASQPVPRGGGAAPSSGAKTPATTGSGNGGGNGSDGSGSGSNDTPAPAPAPAPTPTYNPPPPSSRGGVAVNAAMGQQGVAYRFAAESPGVAFDCSGLTKYAWGQAGVYLPHQSAQQYASTPHVAETDAQPGDLVFYYSPISHVGLYVGGGSMIHAPRTGDVVHVVGVNWNKVVGVSRPG